MAVDNINVGEIALRINVEQIEDRLEHVEAKFSGARLVAYPMAPRDRRNATMAAAVESRGK